MLKSTVMMSQLIPIPHQSQEGSLLLSLPTELQIKIYIFASKHTEAIKPEKWLPRSSKFAHDSRYSTMCWNYRNYTYRSNPARMNGRLPEALTAVDLSTTCRSIYNIVLGDFLLYKLGDFEFRYTNDMLAYIIAIHPRRRNAIRNISVFYDYPGDDESAFTILSLCHGL
jgi:hypothetical protein